MLNHAVLVNGDSVVCSRSFDIYEGTDIRLGCNAVLMMVIKAQHDEMDGGTLYLNGCPGPNEASVIIAAKIKKVIMSRHPEDSDELCAVQALEEQGITVVLNPEIRL